MKIAPVLAFLLLSVVVYARTLNGWFLSDDVMIGVVYDGTRVSWEHVIRVFGADWGARNAFATVLYYRPLVIVTQALDALVWGARPFGFHLTNVLLHGTSGFLSYRIGLAAGARVWAAALAGILFVVFPWNVEPVAWISGRTDVLATTLVLGSLWLHMEASNSADDASRRKLGVLSLALYWLSLMSKEMAITLPALVVVFDLLGPSGAGTFRERTRRALPVWVALAVLTLVYFWVRTRSLGSLVGGGGQNFYGPPGERLARIRTLWGKNLRMLATPFNREAVGKAGRAYETGCVAAGLALIVGALDAARARALGWRIPALALAWFVMSALPFAPGIQVHENLQHSRLIYFPTVWICLLVASLVVPTTRVVGSLSAFFYLGLSLVLLFVNQTPWVEAGDIMRRVTSGYAARFGAYTVRRIEGLLETRRGAFMALFNADIMVRPFIMDPPKPDAVARNVAVYDRRRGELSAVPDPAFGATERWRSDMEHGEWLFPLDGSALDTAGQERITRGGIAGDARSFQVSDRRSWFVFAANRGASLPPLPDSEERAYLLIRPYPAMPPQLFWVSRPGEQLGAPRNFRMRGELTVRDGRAVPREVDGFFVFMTPLPLGKRSPWPGMGKVTVVRLDPEIASGIFDIRFFGIVRRARQ